MKPSSSAPAVRIHSSSRLVRPIFTLAFSLYALVFFYNNNRDQGRIDALHIVPTIVLLIAIARNIHRRLTSITVGGGKLQYQSGLFTRTTRTIDLTRIQDVHVEQTFLQRLLGVGTISLETAGESGRLAMPPVDDPHGVAEFILESARNK